MLKAICIDDGTAVSPGDVLVDFRGNKAHFLSASRANDEARDGKVCMVSVDSPDDASAGEFYARVYGLRVEEV